MVKKWYYKRRLGAELQPPEMKLAKPGYKDYDFKAMVPTDHAGIRYQAGFADDYTIPNLLPIKNQGSTNMCVAFWLARMKEYMELLEHKWYVPMSRGFIYLNRVNTDFMKMFGYDGMIIKEALDHLVKDGTVPESLHSWYGHWYELSETEQRSPLNEDLFPHAEKYRILEYAKCSSDEDIRNALLTQRCGVAINIPITKKFVGGVNEQITMDWAMDNLWGWHCVGIIGWRTINGQKYWLCENSWGDKWGTMNGYFLLPFSYPMHEAWTLVDRANETPYIHVQCGAFEVKDYALGLKKNLYSWGYPTYMVKMNDMYKVQVGAYTQQTYADAMERRLLTDDRVTALNIGNPWKVIY